MGKEVMWLLDNDICPNCEQGSITPNNLTCNHCEFSVNPAFIVWG